MKPPLMGKIRGYVKVQIRGQHSEQLLNLLLAKRITIWDVRRTEDHQVSLFIIVPDFFRLRPYLKKTGCRVHVMERHGLPFSVGQVRRRSFFVTGAFLFLLGLYMLSSLVWTIEVKGNESISTEQVLAAAHQEGIYPFQWTFRLKDTEDLSKALHAKLSSSSWVGVTRQGTKIVIHIVESTVPKARKLNNPRNIVARTDAIITSIIAEEGKAVVKPNDRVRKGQLLISGGLGSPESPLTVVAKGSIRGLVWYEYSIQSPLISKQKVMTGQSVEKSYVQLGQRRLQVSGYGEIPYYHYEVKTEFSDVNVGMLTLPLKWVKEKIMEVQIVEEAQEQQEAVQIGLQHARSDIMAKYGPNARVVTEKILHQKTENGKVKLKVMFEVEQSIAEEQPIIGTS
ncbi:sporulation protein YqfD [Paenibacillus agilis]|nr:sporulation protein YqfD [Paenibacillus agilis]